MSQTDSSSATIQPNENIGLQAAAVAGGWRESVLVLAMVLAPIGLAIILVAIGVLAIAGWQISRGATIEIPTRADLRPYGLLAYVFISWIDVAAVWLWASRRRLRREVFIFRGLTWPALTASIVGFVIAMYAAPIMTHWLSHITSGQGSGVRINFHNTHYLAIYILLFVVTAPVCEEILYRGLLVAWLRCIGWGDSAILLVGSLIFGASHLIPLGFAWSAVTVVFGAMLFAIRLRYDSLSPGWLFHFLFNSQPLLIYPLITWLPPALHPGYLS
jgi:membrane protease YdiL (CAAX protease family)